MLAQSIYQSLELTHPAISSLDSPTPPAPILPDSRPLSPSTLFIFGELSN